MDFFAFDRSACYTKSYGSYIKGTGSILFDRWQGRGADAEEAGLADSDDEVRRTLPVLGDSISHRRCGLIVCPCIIVLFILR